MKIVLATQNRDKLEEIGEFFRDLPVAWGLAADYPGLVLREEGKTLRENALQKARETARVAQGWALADDTGLFVEALGGGPGVRSARYAGAEASYEGNVRKLLGELAAVPSEKRGAWFACVLALVHPDGREVIVEGRLEGLITDWARGSFGFGYDPVFLLPEQNRTLAELTMEEKNRISHRGRALVKMKGVLEGMLETGSGEKKIENGK